MKGAKSHCEIHNGQKRASKISAERTSFRGQRTSFLDKLSAANVIADKFFSREKINEKNRKKSEKTYQRTKSLTIIIYKKYI